MTYRRYADNTAVAERPLHDRPGSPPVREIRMLHGRETAADRVTIHAGGFFVSDSSVVISTLLGSCISACLYDPVNGVVGMNHFLLSNRHYARDLPLCITEAGRYGIHAMELVINGMLNLGAQKKYIRAKTFGGSSMYRHPHKTDSFFCVGEVNIRFVREFLQNERIPLVASDLGGDRGRVIYFSSADYSVLVRKVKKTDQSGLAQKEKRFWCKSIKEQEQTAGNMEIWT